MKSLFNDKCLSAKALPSRVWAMWVALALLGASSWAAAQLTVEGVRMHEAPNYTRVVFDTSGSVSYKLFTLDNPARVVIDLQQAKTGASFGGAGVAVGRKRVKALRTAKQGSNLRIVLDVQGQLKPKGFLLQPVAPYGHRLVVDLFASDAPKSVPKAAPTPRRSRNIVVAVDAGHGGEDPGAVGPNKAREKQVVLQISKRLVDEINKVPGFEGKLVRDGDYYVSLRERTLIARKQRADLFVSVHADAFSVSTVEGASVYTLSERGATSETARWLAAKENQSDLIGGVGNVSLDDKTDTLAQVLLDLSMAANRSISIQAGRSVLGEIGTVAKLHKNAVEQAGFVVLKSPDIPSILVETGYLSNPKEARRLVTKGYQLKIAKAVCNGIVAYMKSAPPTGTQIASSSTSRAKSHRITRGETLSGLASRYRTSMGKIRMANQLSSDSLRIGQVLLIPPG